MSRAARAAALGLALAAAACAGPLNTASERAAPTLLRADAAAASAWISAYRKAHGLSAVTDDAALARA